MSIFSKIGKFAASVLAGLTMTAMAAYEIEPSLDTDLNDFDPTVPVGRYIQKISSNTVNEVVILTNGVLTVGGESINIAEETNEVYKSAVAYVDGATNEIGSIIRPLQVIPELIPDQTSPSNQLADKAWVDEKVESVAAYYITADAEGNAFESYAALTNTTVYYSGGVVRVPTRNDYAVVLADETHGDTEWRYIYAAPDGATSGQWEAQYPIETNDYEALSNKPSISGVTLSGNKTAADLGLASKSDVDPLLFAQYYPDGSVKSVVELTSAIKYDFNDTDRTASALPFCDTGTGEDNHNLTGRVVIPSFVDRQGNPYLFDDGTKYKVVEVVDDRMDGYGNSGLTDIIAPTTVTRVGVNSFCGCEDLVSASFPGMTTVDLYAFYECSSLESIALPLAATIGDESFVGCSALASVAFPSATSIGDAAFTYCSSLASATLPAVTSIGEQSFVDCSALAHVVVPSVRTIGRNAFARCSSLASVEIPSATTVDYAAFTGCRSITAVSAPMATSVGDQAFKDCSALASIELPSATDVGANAFWACSSLKSAALPSATTIGVAAFANCEALASIDIPSATAIGDSAFYHCVALDVLDFGAVQSVPTLGSGAFQDVPTTCKIIVPDAQYDAWKAATNWSDLVTAGYKFLKHSEWEYARRYELEDKVSQTDFNTATNDINVALTNKASISDATLTDANTWTFAPATYYGYPIEMREVEAYPEQNPGVYFYIPFARGSNIGAAYYTVRDYSDTTMLTWNGPDGNPSSPINITATRVALQGYVLGSQTNKVLASEASAEALRAALSGKKNLQTPVPNPTGSSSTADYFVDTITQDAEGVITATRKKPSFTDNWAPISGDGSTGTAINQRGLLKFWRNVISGEWKANTIYEAGADIIIRRAGADSRMYICTSTHTSGTSWDSANWRAVNLADLVTALLGDLEGKANRAANPTAGNLAALDANGNPTDSTIAATNVVQTEVDPTVPAWAKKTVGDFYSDNLYSLVNRDFYAKDMPIKSQNTIWLKGDSNPSVVVGRSQLDFTFPYTQQSAFGFSAYEDLDYYAHYSPRGIYIWPWWNEDAEDNIEYLFPTNGNGGTFALTAGTGHNGNLAALDTNGNPTDSGLSKDDVEGLFFAMYYPDGSVNSAAEFTQGIKYNAPDTVNRTITVKPFCNTGYSVNDNSGLVGRVVIPPFVDGDGNGYISDDGTRFKVVGVSGSPASDENDNLTAIFTPNTVTTIGDGAFFACGSLASVLLPATTGIGRQSFRYCASLTSISLPAATTIGSNAFFACASLTSVLLPAATNIGDYAFGSCISLASVDFGDTPRSSVPTLGADAFSSVPTSCKIVVPDAQYDEWIAATGWSDLVTAGYKFLRHSEWEYARKYELEDRVSLTDFNTATNNISTALLSDTFLTPVYTSYNLTIPNTLDDEDMAYSNEVSLVYDDNQGKYALALGGTRASNYLTSGDGGHTLLYNGGFARAEQLFDLTNGSVVAEQGVTGYVLGSQDDKPLQAAGQSLTKDEFADWTNGTRVAIGRDSTASSNGGVALGRRAKAGNKAVAISGSDGSANTTASGTYSIAIGYHPSATAENAISIGRLAKATARDAAQIGYSATANDREGTLRFRDYEILDENGRIPGERYGGISLSWKELVDARIEGNLVPGQEYRITNYVATTSGDMSSRSANHPFDIIVTADATNALNETARAIQHTASTNDYFYSCNLAAWKIQYCLDNDTNRFAWAVADGQTDAVTGTGGRGVVYRMVDEFNNDVPYDFKGIQFQRWAIANITSTKLTADAISSLTGQFVYSQNGGKCFAYKDSDIEVEGTTMTVDSANSAFYYTFDTGSGGDNSKEGYSTSVYGNLIGAYVESSTAHLNGIVFLGNDCYSNTFGNGCFSNTFGNGCNSNTFGNYCSSNTFGNGCNSNTFGNECYFNTFGDGCSSNTFGNGCNSNTFGNECYSNTFGNWCDSNTFGNGCNSNTFGNYCSSNPIGNGCYSNTFGNECYFNTFGDGTNIRSYYRYITFESGVQYVNLNCTNATDEANYQNVTLKSGIVGTEENPKLITDAVGQAPHTTFQPTGSTVVSVP